MSEFERAADAVVSGDAGLLRQLLDDDPHLVRAHSARPHHATLLHYVAANGHEDERQRTPPNAVEIASLLLRAGAEVDALADMYGHRCTTMQMLVSSVHPHRAGLQVALVDTLVDFGAAVDGVGNDGSPLMTALAFHYPAAAEALVRRGARIDNLLAAAALGRADLVERFFSERRPHGPWPKLPDDPAAYAGWALTWACAYGHRDVAELLLRKGVDPSSRDGEMTAMHAAAAHGHVDLVRLLLQHGASLDARNDYGGTVLGGTLWFAENAPVAGVDYESVVRELRALGGI